MNISKPVVTPPPKVLKTMLETILRRCDLRRVSVIYLHSSYQEKSYSGVNFAVYVQFYLVTKAVVPLDLNH